MKNNHSRTVILIVSFLILIVLFLTSCKNVDPNVRRVETDITVETFSPVTAPPDPINSAPVECIGGGREQPQEVDGVTVDVGAFARRSYELCFMLGQTKFEKVSDIPDDAAVQYAFCLLFYNDLWKMPATGDIYRTASVEEIEKKLEDLFGENDFKVKSSFLYSAAMGKCEMFQPNYGQSIYYNVDSAEKSEETGEFQIFTSFFSDSDKTNILGRTVLTVEIKDKKAFISKLSSEF